MPKKQAPEHAMTVREILLYSPEAAAGLCDRVVQEAGAGVPDDQWDEQHQRGMVAGAKRCAAAFRAGRAGARPKIITLCGSTRFIEYFAIMAWELEKGGAIVLGLHYLPPGYGAQASHQAEAEGVAAHFDALHLQKIDLSDEVLVLNKCGYIGESTKIEIRYAVAHRKPVRWMEPERVPVEFGGALTEPVVPPEQHAHGDLHAETREWCQDPTCPDRGRA